MMTPSGVRNSCETSETKLLFISPSSFSRASACVQVLGALGDALLQVEIELPQVAFARGDLFHHLAEGRRERRPAHRRAAARQRDAPSPALIASVARVSSASGRATCRRRMHAKSASTSASETSPLQSTHCADADACRCTMRARHQR